MKTRATKANIKKAREVISEEIRVILHPQFDAVKAILQRHPNTLFTGKTKHEQSMEARRMLIVEVLYAQLPDNWCF